MNRPRFFAHAFISCLATISCSLLPACGSERAPASFTDVSPLMAGDGLPVAFDRQANVIRFDDTGHPSVESVPTRQPVLSFIGWNADGGMFAYTSLAHLAPGTTIAEPITLSEALTRSLDELVPTGELIVERADGSVIEISQPGAFITAGAWHPYDASLLAYTVSHVNESSAIRIHRLDTGENREVLRGYGLTPDFLRWDESGETIGAYMDDLSLPEQDLGEGVVLPQQIWQGYSVASGRRVSSDGASWKPFRFSAQNPSLELAFERGSNVLLQHAVGDTGARFQFSSAERSDSVLFRADQVRFRGSVGLAYVNFESGEMQLWATNGVAPPEIVMVGSPVSYYIPMYSLQKPYFTQVGTGGGTGCNIVTHKNKLQYAVDIQATAAAYDEVMAPAGGTVSGGVTGVSCNNSDGGAGADGTPCSIYTSPCSCNGGWGNYILIAYADGRYTLHAHLENGASYKVTKCGPVAKGCWLADEGGTGASKGNKNGCGDHLHFQWQNGNFTSADSLAGGFQDAALTSGSCKLQTPLAWIMQCPL